MASYFNQVGNLVARDPSRIDPRILAILEEAANRAGRKVEAYSGYRPGDKGAHGSGSAVDVRLFDPEGKMIPNYQSVEGFGDYEALAKIARQVQMDKYPELADKFRWGGYFGPDKEGKPTYGTMDLMHFDLGGGGGKGMLGGSWTSGVSPALLRAFPGLAKTPGTTLNSGPSGLFGSSTPANFSQPAVPVKPGPGGMIAESTTPYNPGRMPAATPGLDINKVMAGLQGLSMMSSGLKGTETPAPAAPTMPSIGPSVDADNAARTQVASQMFQQLLQNRRRRGMTLGGGF